MQSRIFKYLIQTLSTPISASHFGRIRNTLCRSTSTKRSSHSRIVSDRRDFKDLEKPHKQQKAKRTCYQQSRAGWIGFFQPKGGLVRHVYIGSAPCNGMTTTSSTSRAKQTMLSIYSRQRRLWLWLDKFENVKGHWTSPNGVL
jgi:hypothetical protein